MAIKITGECICCAACEPECPNNAIYDGGVECQGFHVEPQCAAVCPFDCCVPDAVYEETSESLLGKKARLPM